MFFSSWLRSVQTKLRSSRFIKEMLRPTGRMTLRIPHAELLESRRLLTADVMVHVDNKGHLLLDDIAGTSSNITIQYNKTANEFLVTAKTDELTTDGTTFTDHVRVSGALVSRGLIANLGDGRSEERRVGKECA